MWDLSGAELWRWEYYGRWDARGKEWWNEQPYLSHRAHTLHMKAPGISSDSFTNSRARKGGFLRHWQTLPAKPEVKARAQPLHAKAPRFNNYHFHYYHPSVIPGHSKWSLSLKLQQLLAISAKPLPCGRLEVKPDMTLTFNHVSSSIFLHRGNICEGRQINKWPQNIEEEGGFNNLHSHGSDPDTHPHTHSQTERQKEIKNLFPH